MWSPVAAHGQDMRTVADFTVKQGEQVPFVLTWFPSHEEAPATRSTAASPSRTHRCGGRTGQPPAPSMAPGATPLMRSLITLKALTYNPTGGNLGRPHHLAAGRRSVAGATGTTGTAGCAIATLTLESLMRGGYFEEAMAWRNWLLRAVAGDPSDLQIMYGPGGERRLGRVGGALAPGLRAVGPRPDRECGGRSVPTRRLRRGHVGPVRGPARSAVCSVRPSGTCNGSS